jgi:hypothetical protein
MAALPSGVHVTAELRQPLVEGCVRGLAFFQDRLDEVLFAVYKRFS